MLLRSVAGRWLKSIVSDALEFGGKKAPRRKQHCVFELQPLERRLFLTVAPTAPGSIGAFDISSSQIDVTWTNGTGSISNVYVERSTDDASFTRVANFPLAQTIYHDTGLSPGTTYYYRVRDSNLNGNDGGTSDPSTVAFATTSALLGSTSTSTSGVRVAGVTDTVVMLTWNPPPSLSGIASYRVDRDSSTIATTPLPMYIDAGVSPGSSHDYTITALDSDGNALSFSQTVTATTSGGPAFDATPPNPPTSFRVVTATDSTVSLAWAAPSDPSPLTYEILRDGQSVGSTTATTFPDSSLDAQTTYTYSVRAIDPSDNESGLVSATAVTSGTDSTPPETPRELTSTAHTASSISLSWLPATDNEGVSGYRIYRDQTYPPSSVIWTGSATTFTDTSVSAGTSHTYYVQAYDATGYSSNYATTSAMTLAAGPQDAAGAQYIPDVWANDFYDNITKVLRQRIDQVPRVYVDSYPQAPDAARWLSTDSTIFAGSRATSLLVADHVFFHDVNGNGIYDAGEPMWQDPVAGTGSSTYVSGDTILAGNPVDGMPGISGVHYADFNGDYTWSADELIKSDLWQIEGAQGDVAYADLNGDGIWNQGEPVWMDTNHNNIFDAGDTPLYLTPASGQWGKTNGLNSAAVGTHTLVWADNSTSSIQNDFAAAYGAIDAIAPYYANPGRASDTTHDTWTVGDILSGYSGCTPFTGSGTISVNQGSYSVNGSGTNFFNEYVSGDYIQIGGLSYALSPNQYITSTTTSLTLAAPFDQASVSGATYRLINWTKVPGISNSSQYPGMTLSYQRGGLSVVNGMAGAMFPQQFDEMHYVLSQLNTLPNRYGEEFYDSTSSQNLFDAANLVMGIEVSLYGATKASQNGYYSDLTNLISSGDLNPQSVRTFEPISDLEGLVGQLETLTVLRGGQLQADLSSTALATLLPVLYATDGTTVIRRAGAWSSADVNDVSVYTGGLTAPEHLDEITRVANAVIGWTDSHGNKGVWIAAGSTAVTVQQDGETYNYGTDSTTLKYEWDLSQTSDSVNNGETAPTRNVFEQSPRSAWSVNFQGGTGGSNGSYDFGFPIVTLGDVSELINFALEYGKLFDIGQFNSIASTVTQSLVVPGNADSLGGANFTDLLTSAPTDMPLTWGQHITESYDPGDVAAAMQATWDTLTSGNHLTDGVQASTYDDSAGDDFLLRGQLSTDSSGPQNNFGASEDVSVKELPKVDLYGFAAFAPLNQQPIDPPSSDSIALAAAPDSVPLPLTSRMDYLNVVPDSNLDGIVQVDHDQSSFGPDTGSIGFAMVQQMPQVFIPLNTDGTNGGSVLPIHSYLQQGAFGTSDTAIGSLGNDYLTYTNASQNGLSMAYSLDTRVRTNLLITDSANDIKRVEVIRPGGNSVVFDFHWNSGTNQFDPIGVPDSYNDRDQNMLYVLRDLTPSVDTDLSYQMEFSSGITQTFNASTGLIQGVADDASGLSAAVSPATQMGPHGEPTQMGSPRYSINLYFANGQLDHVGYTAPGTTADTITTQLTYAGSGSVTKLQKSDNSGVMSGFGYTVSDGPEIDFANRSLYRWQDSAHEAEIETDDNDGATYTVDDQLFNSNGLLAQDSYYFSDGLGGGPLVTSYTYNTTSPSGLTYDTGRYANGIAAWGQVTAVTNPDHSWEAYAYDPISGWVTDDYTPYKNSANTSLSSGQDAHYSYDAGVSDNGDVADPMLFVAQPRETIDSVAGTTTGITFDRYNIDAAGELLIDSRSGASASDTWGTSLFNTLTTIAGNTTTVNGPDGTTVQTSSGLGDLVTNSFDGHTVSTDNSYYNVFGGPSPSGDQSYGVGEEPDTITAAGEDAFGRPASVTEDGIQTTYQNYNWFGPQTVVAADGSQTTYTYNQDGTVHSMTAADGVVTTYTYDVVGNVIQTTVSHGSDSTTTRQFFDGLGREIESIDGLGDITENIYSSSASGTTETTKFEVHGTTTLNTIDTTVSDLDGTQVSDSGTSVATPSIGDEGIVSAALTIDGVSVPVGSTWTKAYADQDPLNPSVWDNYTIGYYNLLGQEIATQSTDFNNGADGVGAPTLDTADVYDGNGRISQFIDTDGTSTYYEYDPTTGELAATWVDNNGNGQFDEGIDTKQENHPSALTVNDATLSGTTSDDDSNGGVQADYSATKNGGLDTEQIVDGQTTTSHTAIGTGGNDTTTTTNPDGSTTVDDYLNGQLTEEDSYAGTTLTGKTTYEYDDLGRNDFVHQFTADPSSSSTALTIEKTTQFKYDNDGNITETDNPDGTVDSTTIDPLTGEPTVISNADGTAYQDVNAKGQITDQYGSQVTPASYEYDPVTGNVAAVHLFGTGSIGDNSTASENISYSYDPSSGLLTGKGYGDYGPVSQYLYNSKNQLTDSIQYNSESSGNSSGNVDTSFTYDNAGRVTAAQITNNTGDGGPSFNDQTTYDDQGRTTSQAETSTDGTSVAEAFTYDPITGQLASEAQGTGIAADYHYYGPQDNQTGQEPGALKDLSFDQNGTAVGAQSFTYDDAGRVQTMTLDGQETFTYNYVAGTDQIANVTVSTPGAGNALYTAFGYNPQTGEITSINANTTTGGTTTSGGSTIYNASYGYDSNGDGLRSSESVSQLTFNGSTSSYAWNFGYDGQQQLTSVTNASDSSTVNSYTYDQLGNRTGTSLGSVNGFNEYSNLSYDGRGDVTDDGSYSYTWNAKGELASVISDSPTIRSKEYFTYDAQGLLVSESSSFIDSGGNWTNPSIDYSFVYDNQQRLVEVVGSDNTVWTHYAWGPDGKLAGVVQFDYGTLNAFAAVPDANGNVNELINVATGQTYAEQVDAYGNRISGGSLDSFYFSPFTFAGMMRDANSGLYFAANNVYDPRIGKWLHPDVTGENGGWNTSVYCNNDPVNLVDPQGTAPEPNWDLNVPTDPKAIKAMGDLATVTEMKNEAYNRSAFYWDNRPETPPFNDNIAGYVTDYQPEDYKKLNKDWYDIFRELEEREKYLANGNNQVTKFLNDNPKAKYGKYVPPEVSIGDPTSDDSAVKSQTYTINRPAGVNFMDGLQAGIISEAAPGSRKIGDPLQVGPQELEPTNGSWRAHPGTPREELPTQEQKVAVDSRTAGRAGALETAAETAAPALQEWLNGLSTVTVEVWWLKSDPKVAGFFVVGQPREVGDAILQRWVKPNDTLWYRGAWGQGFRTN